MFNPDPSETPLVDPTRFWRSIAWMALVQSSELLFDKFGRAITQILLFGIYLILVFHYLPPAESKTDFMLHALALIAPLLIFPIVWVLSFLWNVKQIYKECYRQHAAFLDKVPQLKITLFQHDGSYYCEIYNNGGHVTVTPSIDLSETQLNNTFHVPVEPQWLDGYAGGYRIFNENTKNVFRIRELAGSPNGYLEKFFGTLGARSQEWLTDMAWVDGVPGLLPPTRIVTLQFNSNPQFLGGSRKVVIRFCGRDMSLISGDAKIRSSTGPPALFPLTPAPPEPPKGK